MSRTEGQGWKREALGRDRREGTDAAAASLCDLISPDMAPMFPGASGDDGENLYGAKELMGGEGVVEVIGGVGKVT